MSAQQGLIGKIERFVRKFYANRLIQGVLVGAALWIVFFLLVNALEYFSWFSSTVRFVLLLLLLAGTAFVAVFYFIIPLVNLIRFRKKMSVSQAALMIGRFFPDIQDKLLNTLQLADDFSADAENELLAATVEQRTEQLKPIRFTDAVDLKGNLKYLWIVLPLLVLLVCLLVFLPRFAVQPTQRIIHYDQAYQKPLPFEVTLSDEALETHQGADVPFSIHVVGSQIPDAFFVKSSLGQQMLTKSSTNDFQYVFKNLYHDVTFQVIGGEYVSPPITIKVHPNPALLSYRCVVSYPPYIHRSPEVFEGKTRLLVPQGSRMEFSFSLRDADSAMVWMDSVATTLPLVDGMATYRLTASATTSFEFACHNEWSSDFDPLRFSVDVLPDAYPEIRVESFTEDFSTLVYYSGLIADDYGFSKLTFNCQVKNPVPRDIVLPVVFDRSQSRTSFFYHFNMDSLGILPGQDLEVFFEVWDNDGFHGPKSKRSETFTYYKPSLAALDSVADQTESEIMEQMAERAEDASRLRDEIERMLQELASKKELDWSDKEKMKELLEKQAQIEEEWNRLQEEQQRLNEFMKDNGLADEETLKKQEQINNLFEQLIPEELRKMMEEIERLLDEMPREQMQQLLQEMKKDNTKMQDLLDRNLALLEQLRMEKELNDLFNQLDALGQELQQDSAAGGKSAEQAQKEFEEMMRALDSLQEANKLLSNPFSIQKDDSLAQSIEQDLTDAAQMEQDSGDNQEQEGGEQEGSEQQEGGDQQEGEEQDGGSEQQQGSPQQGNQQGQQQNKAGQKKKDAGQKMQQMAQSMMMQMDMGGEEQLAEDAHLVRILLENVVRASHQQESLMASLGRMRTDDPSITEKIVLQKELSSNFLMVQDSLKAMAMRQPSIQNFVFDELSVINQQTEVALKNMNDLRFPMAVGYQQRALQSMNNLALMLAESLQQMEDSMMGSGASSRRSKPQQGQQGKSMQTMEQLQQQLGEQLKQLQQQMQQQGGTPNPQLSEELARMAAEQEMIRQGMQQLLNEMKANGQIGDDGLNQIIQDMEKLEEEIVNKRITNQTLERNRQILSRMLESEKAQQKRDQDEQRKSNEYRGSAFERQVDELFYQQSLKRQQEFLRQQPVQYQPYYRTKINEYYLKKHQN